MQSYKSSANRNLKIERNQFLFTDPKQYKTIILKEKTNKYCLLEHFPIGLYQIDVIQTNRKMLQILCLRTNTKKLEIKTIFENLKYIRELISLLVYKNRKLKSKA